MLRVEGLSLAAPDGRPVLEGASFELGDGEAMLVTGPTGSGKTTLLYALGGLLQGYMGGLQSGQIYIDGLSPSEALRRHLVLYVPQDPSNSFLGFDVYTELRWRGASEEKVKEVASALGISGLLGRKVYELSGGEAQKVSVAFALASGYRLVLLDEPFANLDERSRRELVELLKLAMDMGTSFVVAEHRTSYLSGLAGTRLSLSVAQELPGRFPLEPRPIGRSGVAVEARGLSYSYDGRPALSGLDLDVRYGEVVALVGENGSGKSTALKIIAGLLRGPRIRRNYRKVGFVLQSPELQFVGDTVFEEASLEAHDRSWVVPVLRYMGLLERGSAAPQSLSRGQRVRLAVASAALKRPDVLLLDEPTEGQDRFGIEAIKEVVGWARGSGFAVLLVTQERWFADEVADRVVVVGNGS